MKGGRDFMDMLRRIIGAALIVIASVVAVHTIVEPLYQCFQRSQSA